MVAAVHMMVDPMRSAAASLYPKLMSSFRVNALVLENAVGANVLAS